MPVAISVIVPVLNELQALTRLIQQLLQVDSNTQTQFEVLICDGGSTDLSAPMIRKLQKQAPVLKIHWLSSTPGRAAQMTLGAQLAKADTLFFVHADSILPPDWINLIVAPAWGRFNVSLSGDNFLFRIIERMMNFRSCVTQVATGDQAIFVKKQLYDAVGGWDDIPLMEDIALCKKLRKKTNITCLNARVTTSSRRWTNKGILNSILLMWWLRLLFFLGKDTQYLHRLYYPQLSAKSATVLQVFSKLAIKGSVKTRLIPDIGATKATQLHQYLLNDCLARCAQFNAPLQLWLAPYTASSTDAASMYQQHHLYTQQGADLGERMGYAIQQGLQSFHKVILIGTDQLGLNAQVLRQCETNLNEFDAVIVPAEDGGFVAIACKLFDAQFFQRIQWSSESVLSQLQCNLNDLCVTYKLLAPVRDIDTIDDVTHYPELIQLLN